MNWSDAFQLVLAIGAAIYDGVRAGKSQAEVLADAHSILDSYRTLEADVDAAAAGSGPDGGGP